MAKRVQYQTREGALICTSDIDPCSSHGYAIRQAIKAGAASLVAIDSRLERRTDYTNILQGRLAKLNK